MTSAFRLALECRADGDGIIPYPLLAQLTPEEWNQIRLITQLGARKLLKDSPRTTTARFSEERMAQLVEKSRSA